MEIHLHNTEKSSLTIWLKRYNKSTFPHVVVLLFQLILLCKLRAFNSGSTPVRHQCGWLKPDWNNKTKSLVFALLYNSISFNYLFGEMASTGLSRWFNLRGDECSTISWITGHQSVTWSFVLKLFDIQWNAPKTSRGPFNGIKIKENLRVVSVHKFHPLKTSLKTR